MIKKLFAVIGTGYIFRTHLKAIVKLGGRVIDMVNKENDQNSWKEMVKKTPASYIVILTPNNLHFEMAEFSAKEKKIVLCEKPLTINSKDCEKLTKYPNIFTVFQLRYHPLLKKIKKEISKVKKHKIQMNIFFRRDDPSYIQSWKNKKECSGGFLFNLGIHYFDLLLYLFGDPKKIKVEKIYELNTQKPYAQASGFLEGDNYLCQWQIFVNKKRKGKIIKKREFIINGKSYNFSWKDNLAQENLHYFVYKDLLGRKGIGPKEALKTIQLIEKIYNSNEK